MRATPLLLLMFLASLAACPSPGPEPADDDDTTDDDDCVDGVPDADWPYTCEHEFCPPDDLAVSLTAADPAPCYTALASPCADQTDEGFFFYKFEPEGFYVDIGFDSAVGANPTDAQMLDAFSFLTVEWGRVEPTPQAGLDFVFYQRWDGPAAFDSFTIADGRLQAEVAFDITVVQYNLYGIDDNCLVENDIILNCTCRFDGFSIPSTFQLDLPLMYPAN